jgi:hypothetical protein
MYPSSTIEVPFIRSISQYSSINDISSALDHLSKNKIGYAPWPEYPYRPECAFAMAHGNNCIFLKFFIAEDDILARFTEPNDMVHQDSCVEFFISFNGEAEYYNLEFNCIGTCFLGYGFDREQREVASVEAVRKIKSDFLLYSDQGKMKWELTLLIPNDVFYHHNYAALASKTGRANFYKCGDDLPVPHYLAWNNIKSTEPNFHLPEFFGDISFSATAAD